jgi:hypothetical protein
MATTTPPPSPPAVVWEAHITDLIRRDSRWGQVWRALGRVSTIPDAAVTYPGHASQRESKPGRTHQEELARCKQDPSPLVDGLSELRQRVLGRAAAAVGRRRGRSLSTTLSTSSASTPPGSDIGEDGEDGGWVLHRGRFVRRGGLEEEEQYGEEAYIRELLAGILATARSSQPSDGGGSSSGKGNKPGKDALVQPRGLTYYPPGGYRAWEKGSFDAADSWRLAIVHNIPAGRSLFRYRHPTTGQVGRRV